MTMIVNLYGGPGTGKSTTMAALFTEMKRCCISVEMAPEWVKLPVWAGELHVLEDQLYIFAKQNHMLRRLADKVDYVITDAPLLMSLVYSQEPQLASLVRSVAHSYRNMHIFLRRVKPYSSRGRVQDESKARKLDLEIREMLHLENTNFLMFDGDADAAKNILPHL